MTVFRFRFCNDLLNSTGHIFHTCQRQIEVHGLDCRDQATEIAKRQFEQQEGIAAWHFRASSIECEELRLETGGQCEA